MPKLPRYEILWFDEMPQDFWCIHKNPRVFAGVYDSYLITFYSQHIGLYSSNMFKHSVNLYERWPLVTLVITWSFRETPRNQGFEVYTALTIYSSFILVLIGQFLWLPKVEPDFAFPLQVVWESSGWNMRTLRCCWCFPLRLGFVESREAHHRDVVDSSLKPFALRM